MMHGHEKSDFAIVAVKPANKVALCCGAIRGGASRSGAGGAKGGDQGECGLAKQRTGLSARLACHRRRDAYGDCLPFGPEVGAVCGKAARTVLCGGRVMKHASLPLRRRAFIAAVGGAAVWPLAARAQQPERVRRIAMLLPATTDDLQVRTFLQALSQLGWTNGWQRAHRHSLEHNRCCGNP